MRGQTGVGSRHGVAAAARGRASVRRPGARRRRPSVRQHPAHGHRGPTRRPTPAAGRGPQAGARPDRQPADFAQPDGRLLQLHHVGELRHQRAQRQVRSLCTRRNRRSPPVHRGRVKADFLVIEIIGKNWVDLQRIFFECSISTTIEKKISSIVRQKHRVTTRYNDWPNCLAFRTKTDTQPSPSWNEGNRTLSRDAWQSTVQREKIVLPDGSLR